MNSKKLIPVSVIIPCFNCADTVNRAVSSVYSQSVLPIEVILVDDFSSDETYSKICELKKFYSNITVIRSEFNQGAASARNLGWDHSSQPYIAFLDSDDSWHPEKLRLQYDFMIKHPNVVLSGHQCVFFNKYINIENFSDFFHFKKIRTLSILFRNPFNTPAVMLKREIPLRFRPGKRYAEDFLLWQLIVLNRFEVYLIEKPLAFVHKPLYGAGGLSKNLIKMEIGELENIFLLYKNNHIGFLLLLLSICFSLIKFIKRFIFVYAKIY